MDENLNGELEIQKVYDSFMFLEATFETKAHEFFEK